MMDRELLSTILEFILFVVKIYQYGMIVYFLTSWLPGVREGAFGQFLSKIYEPFIEPFRKVIPPLGMFDISSLVALITLSLFQYGLFIIFNMFVPVGRVL